MRTHFTNLFKAHDPSQAAGQRVSHKLEVHAAWSSKQHEQAAQAHTGLADSALDERNKLASQGRQSPDKAGFGEWDHNAVEQYHRAAAKLHGAAARGHGVQNLLLEAAGHAANVDARTAHRGNKWGSQD